MQHLYSSSVSMLHFTACLFKAILPKKAQSALIGQLSHAWAGTDSHALGTV